MHVNVLLKSTQAVDLKLTLRPIHLSCIFGVFNSQRHGISKSHTRIKSDNGRGNYYIIKRGAQKRKALHKQGLNFTWLRERDCTLAERASFTNKVIPQIKVCKLYPQSNPNLSRWSRTIPLSSFSQL